MSTSPQPTFTPEFAKAFAQMMLGRIERERATTRRVIEAVPENKSGYRPEPKSRSALELAHHIAVSEVWFLNSIADGSFAWAEPEPAKNIAQVLADYDKAFAPALARARQVPAEQLVAIIDFFGMKFPAFTYIQFCQDHTVHHRGQLSTYLRPMGSKVPDIYGGSADEPFQS